MVGVPTIPRDQLLRLLNDDLLPRFSRIFSDRTTECEGEKELLEYSSPESQSVWLKEHLDALREERRRGARWMERPEHACAVPSRCTITTP